MTANYRYDDSESSYSNSSYCCTYSIAAAIHWVPQHSGIPGNHKADCQANHAGEGRGYRVSKRKYTSAINRARQMSEGKRTAKPK